jgi:transposase
MCLRPLLFYQVPEETERVARAAFPKANLCMRLYDELGAIYSDPMFAPLFPVRGQPAESPTRLALVLILQFLENLTDRQAADAVRGRIDWKYLLGLELTDPGFDFSILSEFRDRLLEEQQESFLLDTLLDQFQERGLLKARGRQRTDSTHVQASVRELNRLELVGRTLQAALNALAQQAPAWLRTQVRPEWFDRYSRLIDDYRLPKDEAKRRSLAETIGADGCDLLARLAQPTSPAGLAALEAVQVLRQVWEQQYRVVDGHCRWREVQELVPAAQLITTPHDLNARYSVKRSTIWIGYKAHLTETCDDELPHLITHVRTTPATEDDSAALPPIHAALSQDARLPATHLVDSGYTTGAILVSSAQEYGVEVLGPVRPDSSWQAQQRPAQAGTAAEAVAPTESPQRFDIRAFQVDWSNKQVVCPRGQVSRNWNETNRANGKTMIQVQFDKAACQECTVRERCTRRKGRGRGLTLQPQAIQEAIQAARAREQTPEFRQAYARRAGVEGTISEAAVAHEMRRSRYVGVRKTSTTDCPAGANRTADRDRDGDGPGPSPIWTHLTAGRDHHQTPLGPGLPGLAPSRGRAGDPSGRHQPEP